MPVLYNRMKPEFIGRNSFPSFSHPTQHFSRGLAGLLFPGGDYVCHMVFCKNSVSGGRYFSYVFDLNNFQMRSVTQNHPPPQTVRKSTIRIHIAREKQSGAVGKALNVGERNRWKKKTTAGRFVSNHFHSRYLLFIEFSQFFKRFQRTLHPLRWHTEGNTCVTRTSKAGTRHDEKVEILCLFAESNIIRN